MASLHRRSWKLQDFMAHDANVNCLALGHKSGRVMVTGGDDKKVNLWAIGKESCFMSLSGHQTPIECVQFNQLEELVCAGSRAGALKVWDLEAAKLVRTLNGHKYTIKCIDFHPYGDYLASGSADNSIKMWDTRKKGVLYTYNGHKGTVNSLKFSPDGQWVASGGEDSTIKIWDLRVGRVLKEFTDHSSAVTSVEFHPHEFLLATGSVDRSVNFFDLENFSLVSSESELGAVRCLCFNQDGDCLFTGVRDYLKIVGWEPSRLHDSVPVTWGRVCDISSAQNQLVGASFHLTNVQIYVVDLKKCNPSSSTVTSDTPFITGGSPFSQNSSIRKSFSKAERPSLLKGMGRMLDVKTIEESTSGTDPEEESQADITNLTDYKEIFGGRGLTRTPPPEPEPFQEPERDFSDPAEPQVLGRVMTENVEALSLDNDLNYRYHHPEPPALSPNQYSRSKSNLDQVYLSRLSKEANSDQIYMSRLSKQQNHKHEQLSSLESNEDIGGSNLPGGAVVMNNRVKGGGGGQRHVVGLQRQNSDKSGVKSSGSAANNAMKHSASEASINANKGIPPTRNTSRKNSFSRQNRNSSVPNVSATTIPIKMPNSARFHPPEPIITKPKSIEISTYAVSKTKSMEIPTHPVDIYVSTKLSPDEDPVKENDDYVPASIDRPMGLNLDDFMPKNFSRFGFGQQQPDMSEAEVLNVLLTGHETFTNIMTTRQRSVRLVVTQYRSKELKAAVETAVSMDDVSVLVDVLGVINQRYNVWNLDLCVIVLPKILDMLQSKYEQIMTVGCNTLKLILRHFGPVIRSNIQAPVGSFGVDIPREERYKKSVKCHELLSQLRSCVAKKQTLPGNLGSSFREVISLMETYLD